MRDSPWQIAKQTVSCCCSALPLLGPPSQAPIPLNSTAVPPFCLTRHTFPHPRLLPAPVILIVVDVIQEGMPTLRAGCTSQVSSTEEGAGGGGVWRQVLNFLLLPRGLLRCTMYDVRRVYAGRCELRVGAWPLATVPKPVETQSQK